MQELGAGKVRKMAVTLEEPVAYAMRLGDARIPLNAYLGKGVRLNWSGEINCIHCDRKTGKSFNQGYCYPCFRKLARCDSCIMSPEKCHYDAGTCREPEWARENCMVDHVVYLANTSGLKVGITRHTQVPTRWIDQGATRALPVFGVATRYYSGLMETVLREHVTDRTSWQAMLKGGNDEADLFRSRDELLQRCTQEIEALQNNHGLQAFQPLSEVGETVIQYPVLEYPQRVKSFNLDKNPLVEGSLLGIRGQYLIFDTGVINMRKYGGYHLSLSTE